MTLSGTAESIIISLKYIAYLFTIITKKYFTKQVKRNVYEEHQEP